MYRCPLQIAVGSESAIFMNLLWINLDAFTQDLSWCKNFETGLTMSHNPDDFCRIFFSLEKRFSFSHFWHVIRFLSFFSGFQERFWGLQQSFPQISAGERSVGGVDKDTTTSRRLGKPTRMSLFLFACGYELYVQRHGPSLSVEKDWADYTGRYCGVESENYAITDTPRRY